MMYVVEVSLSPPPHRMLCNNSSAKLPTSLCTCLSLRIRGRSWCVLSKN